MAGINLGVIGMLYKELSNMHEPLEGDKSPYFQQLYRTYRNFLINTLSAVLIF